MYSIGCPRCNVLKQKLDQKGIKYTENDSVEEMQKLGISLVPVLCVGDMLMDFTTAIQWVNDQ